MLEKNNSSQVIYRNSINWNHKVERVFPCNLPHKKKKPLFGTCPTANSLIDIPGRGKQQSYEVIQAATPKNTTYVSFGSGQDLA